MQAIRYLIHFYNQREYLFQTVTMHQPEEREAVLDALAEAQGWFWGRFARSERAAYMLRRVAVEAMLRGEFESSYWHLQDEKPAYLYQIPGLDPHKVGLGLADRRIWNGEHTKYLVFDLDQISARSSLTFTVEDSFRSYRAKLLAQGLPCRELTTKLAELPDYGQVFPIDALEEVYQRNKDAPDLRFEVQVWDRAILLDYLSAHGA